MRPVNLIPVEERRGASRAPAGSTGKGVYVVLGVLGLALFGTVLVVLQGNKINNQKSELAKLKAEQSAAKLTADSAAPAVAFEEAAQARFDAVYKTAADRFNFERRLRQLTRAVPNSVRLSDLKASLAGKGGEAGSEAPAGAADSGGDPSFDLNFCVIEGDPWQQSAEMITRMRNLDGVKKVTITKGEDPQGAPSGAAPAPGSNAGSSPASGAESGGAAGGPCGGGHFTGGLNIAFKGKGSAAPAAAATQTATQQAQGAGATSGTANSAAGADGSAPAGGTP